MTKRRLSSLLANFVFVGASAVAVGQPKPVPGQAVVAAPPAPAPTPAAQAVPTTAPAPTAKASAAPQPVAAAKASVVAPMAATAAPATTVAKPASAVAAPVPMAAKPPVPAPVPVAVKPGAPVAAAAAPAMAAPPPAAAMAAHPTAPSTAPSGAPAAQAPVVAAAPAAPAMAVIPKPAPELDQMKVLEGRWRCDGRAPAGPTGPEHAYKSTWKFKRDLDNFWWAAEYQQTKAKAHPTPMKARGYITYDQASKTFVLVGVDNMGGTSTESTTGWSGDVVTLAGDANMAGKKVPYREVITKKGTREFTWRGEMKMGGDWVTLGEDRCRKRAKEETTKAE